MTNPKPDDASGMALLRRKLLDSKVDEVLRQTGLKLVDPRALADLQRLAAADLDIKADDGATVDKASGRFKSLFQWVEEMRTGKPFLFAPGQGPIRPFDGDGLPVGSPPDGDPPLPRGAERWIEAHQMGDHIAELAAGKVAVRATGDQPAAAKPGGNVVSVAKAGSRIEDLASGKVTMAQGSAPTPRDPNLSAWSSNR